MNRAKRAVPFNNGLYEFCWAVAYAVRFLPLSQVRLRAELCPFHEANSELALRKLRIALSHTRPVAASSSQDRKCSPKSKPFRLSFLLFSSQEWAAHLRSLRLWAKAVRQP